MKVEVGTRVYNSMNPYVKGAGVYPSVWVVEKMTAYMYSDCYKDDLILHVAQEDDRRVRMALPWYFFKPVEHGRELDEVPS